MTGVQPPRRFTPARPAIPGRTVRAQRTKPTSAFPKRRHPLNVAPQKLANRAINQATRRTMKSLR